MLHVLVFSLLVIPVLGYWDCQYSVGKNYHYTFTSDLVSKVPDKVSAPFTLHGLTINGKVTLTPLSGAHQPLLVELYVENVQENNIETFYSQEIDRQTFSAVFYPLRSTLQLPLYQSVYGSNLLRGIASTFRIKSCTQTGVYSVDEESILGTHTTHYISRTVNHGMMDERFGDTREKHARGSVNNDNLEITRTIGQIREEGLFVGNTAHRHAQFVRSLLNRTSTRQYSYMTSTGNVIYNCVMYERYSPQHVPGYATSSDITVRTSLKLVSTALYDKDTALLDVNSVIKRRGFSASKDIKMEHAIPRLNPHSDFIETAANLKRLLSAGYERTSTAVMKCWLDIVRHLYAGVPYDKSRSVFAAKYDPAVLSWLIDAVNVNGTAHLHLLIHNAIKLSRAHHLTERFIATKQFTPNPPLRMIKWLLKTCDIDRYEEVCALAISSSATNYYHSDTGRVSFVWDIFDYLKNRINKSKTLNERVFFIKSLGNLKLREVSAYLVERGLNEKDPSARKAAATTLHNHPNHFVQFDDRQNLLKRALKEQGLDGASMLYYVLSTASADNIALLIERAVSTVCSGRSHPLSTFLHQTLSLLLDTRSNPSRGGAVRAVVERLHSTCNYCLPAQQSHNPSEHVTAAFLFGSKMLGAEMKHERFSDPSTTQLNSGKTSLVLGFLENYGIVPNIVQSSFDISDLEVFKRGYTTGEMHVVVAGEKLKSPTFQVGGGAENDANLLLIDVTAMLPTISALPVSYTIAGNLRSDSKIRSEGESTTSNKPQSKIVLENKLGIYISTEFNLDGTSTGWVTSLTFNTQYQDTYTMTHEHVHVHTEVQELTFNVHTELDKGWSAVPENVNYFQPTTLLNSTLSLDKREMQTPNDYSCNVMEKGPEIRSFGLGSAVFDKKSYLGQWFIDNKLIDMYPSQIYELENVGCSQVYLLQDIDIVDTVVGHHYYVTVQALYGLIVISPHNRVTVFGDRDERNLRLQGELVDIVEMLRHAKYYPLEGYSGPELLTVSVERNTRNRVAASQSSLLLYVSDPCT